MQKTAYEMRISDWSSDVFSSDLTQGHSQPRSDLLGDPQAGGRSLAFQQACDPSPAWPAGLRGEIKEEASAARRMPGDIRPAGLQVASGPSGRGEAGDRMDSGSSAASSTPGRRGSGPKERKRAVTGKRVTVHRKIRG